MEEDQVRGFDPVSDNLSQFVTVRERAEFVLRYDVDTQ
jgi:hypothetical protein